MRLPSALRQLVVRAGFGLLLAAAAILASATPRSLARPAAVHGLIVQLRDAPSHVALAREQAQARDAGMQEREAGRWQRLLADLRSDGAVLRELPQWAHAAPRRDPVGASAQLLRFAQPLSTEQAERVAARLAARPEVAWVALNTRERRQATAGNAPSDPYFPGTAGQWWLQPVQGSNGSAIESRLRGVPGFLSAWQGSSTGSAAAVVAVIDSGITCHPDLGNSGPGCIGGAILPGYDFVGDSVYANDGDGRDADPRDPGDWVSQADRNADPVRYGDCDVEDSSWHGTIIAGVVAAQTDNNLGAAAINWHGRVLPVRVAGKCGADVVDIVEGMRWAAGLAACKRSNGAGGCAEFAPANPNPARIVNISFGGSAVCGALYQQALDELRAAPGGGAVVVAAAGNGWSAPSRPANCQRVIGVGALNRDGFKTNYSNFGAALTLSTVGGDDNDGAWGALLGDSGVLTIGNGGLTAPADCTQVGINCYYYHFGSSFSAPVVAGAVSLMLSVNPALSLVEIEQGLVRSARPHVTSGVAGFDQCSADNPGRCVCTTSTCGAGILDATQALLYAASPGSYVAPAALGAVLDTPELRSAVAGGPDRPARVDGGGGGGAVGAFWLLALACATLALGPRLSRRSLPLPGSRKG
ncbi:MAG: S8 family serine peptidase [Pseudomonadota bacterium]